MRSLSNTIYNLWPVPDDNNHPYYIYLPDNLINTSRGNFGLSVSD